MQMGNWVGWGLIRLGRVRAEEEGGLVGLTGPWEGRLRAGWGGSMDRGYGGGVVHTT